MQFYKIYGELTKNENDEGKKKKRDLSHMIASRTAEFNGTDSSHFCFLADIGDEFVSFGLITADSINLTALAERYARFIGINVKLTSPDEVTLYTIRNLLCGAHRQDFIVDDDEILERFEISKLGTRYNLEFGENLINSKAKKDELLSSAKKLLASDTLIPELERIYEGSKASTVKGHPVHYIVETDNRDTRRGLYKTVLDALYANNRLESCRYSYLDFHPGQSYSQMAFESLYKLADGGAIIIRYLSDDDSEMDSASGEMNTVENICEMARRYRNRVLTVICFPRECKKTKYEFYKNLGTMSFVEIKEDLLDGRAAKEFLASLAREKHVRSDKKLLLSVSENESYRAPELVSMFEEWYNGKLKTMFYPQYKNVATVRKSTVKSVPNGSAYDELSEMVGLAEAKAVIKKALNYYKMQKIYAERGVRQDTPAMHMIFTGNPGTAKTTVARLFARIMKENGLLSRGQLIEVGRGDLVGKYMGWTAQNVQNKFKEASGGVLFIDEAYSLVDDRCGAYGDEAINTIVQEMENHRADVVVIFAGYPDKMEGFIEKNPGLRSRIAFHVPFADYSGTELCMIAELLSRRNGMRIESAALLKLEKAFNVARTNTDFGNGRYVRNIFEQAKMNQASRLLEKDFDDITSDEITTITAEDIVVPENEKREARRIGFC